MRKCLSAFLTGHLLPILPDRHSLRVELSLNMVFLDVLDARDAVIGRHNIALDP